MCDELTTMYNKFHFYIYSKRQFFYIWIISVLVVITFKARSEDILCTPTSAKISADAALLLLLLSAS